MVKFSLRKLGWTGLLVTLAATLANCVYYGLTRAAGEPYLMPLNGTGSRIGTMPLLMPVVATLLSGLSATLLFILLARFTRQPQVIFLSVAVTATLVSFGGPASLPESTSTQTRILLSGMHLLTALVISIGLVRWGPLRRDRNG